MVAGPDGLAPTDVVPWVQGTGSIEVVDLRVAGGASVPFTVRQSGTGGQVAIEILPASLLEPDTDYEIEVGGVEWAASSGPLTFRTGAGPSSAPPPAPPAITMRFVDQAEGSDVSCGNSMACFSSPAFAGPSGVELTIRPDDGSPLPPILMNDAVLMLSARSYEAPFCVEARTRDVAGRRSAPTTMCSTEAEQICVAELSACSGPEVPCAPHASSSGCAIGARIATGGAWPAVLIALGAWQLRRRRPRGP